MSEARKKDSKKESKLHPRNKHQGQYDFKKLTKSSPDLAPFARKKVHGNSTIDFSNPKAVLALNKALLKDFYGINFWEIPTGYLCPPIPGRADYIHHIADLLASRNNNDIPKGKKIHCLDIGTGANCIYPIIGVLEYGWSFTGTDIDTIALSSAQRICKENESLNGHVQLRKQQNPIDIFLGIFDKKDKFEVTICNPPFHNSSEEAVKKNIRKNQNLTKQAVSEPSLNFGGQNNELWCKGGEMGFLKNMIRQSKWYGDSCLWFTSLVSKKSNLKLAQKTLNKFEAVQVEIIPMEQGNKESRILAWSFLTKEQQEDWLKKKARK